MSISLETRIPSSIYLYDGSGTKSLKLKEIAQYLIEKLGNIQIEIREDFVSFYLYRLNHDDRETSKTILAKNLALCRIRNLTNKNQLKEPLPMEIEYEKKNLFYKAFGILYDGFKISILFSDMIPEDKFDLSHCHIIFTNQLFGTWDENDKRYHARVSVYGFPSIISTTGVVEAPAKPRDFYLKQKLGVDSIALMEEFKGRFIDYDDLRMTEVMKGYVMQAIFFHITGEPFCANRNCRLYNAHWQEEVIQAQLKGDRFCDYHQKILNKIRETNPYSKKVV